ncbi:unnamed protein product [Somion occarium]|uniref:Polycomb protein VEFS-Box domain-containing protein n=1 Tax=Somion occarium TaxID=3059160 RepID=A0ABP1DLN9_9APHY
MERHRYDYDPDRPLPSKFSSVPHPPRPPPGNIAPWAMRGRPMGPSVPRGPPDRYLQRDGGYRHPSENRPHISPNYRGRGRGRTMTKASGWGGPPARMNTKAAGTSFPPRMTGGVFQPIDNSSHPSNDTSTFKASGRPSLPTKVPSKFSSRSEDDARRRKRDINDVGQLSSTGARGFQPRKAARKYGFYLDNGVLRPTKSANDDSEEDHPVDKPASPPRPRKTMPHMQAVAPVKAARKHDQVASKSSISGGHNAQKTISNPASAASADIIELSDSDEAKNNTGDDIAHLLSALSNLNIGARRLREHSRLPFLRRNLRHGFLAKCRMAGVQVAPKNPPAHAVDITYRYLHDDDESGSDGGSSSSSVDVYEERRTSMLTWLCPLCDMHGEFPRREVLKFHLDHDHAGVNVDWINSSRNQAEAWRMIITIPPAESIAEIEVEFEEDDDESEKSDSPSPESPAAADDDSDFIVEISPPGTLAIESMDNPVSPIVLDDDDDDVQEALPPVIEIKHKFRAPSPPLLSTLQNQREDRDSGRPPSYRGSLPDRYPSPPPPSNLHGPAAQYPYLYAVEKEGETVYSCRPGGPRLFDLLNTLPLKRFGVLSWMIVDREEELYELEDVNDEDKCMLALWNRWIMLNRVKFVFEGYADGVTEFIDEYWRMIHLAAGWGALRAFLLMLMTERYLTVSEVARLLKYYEEKTGMKDWYKNTEDALE